MWLALCFPNWALDCRSRSDDAPRLVVEAIQRHRYVIGLNPPAYLHGARRGMRLADARMRLPAVEVHERSVDAEQAAMQRLAGWAWRYSDQVHCLSADDSGTHCARLVLEIGASLKLFGGRGPLLDHITSDLEAWEYFYRSGLGDTPQAALACSRGNRLASDPGSLPLSCLDLEPKTLAMLQASGFTQTGELLTLPSDALQRRFGASLLEYLQQLRGLRPHGLTLYRPPERYHTHHELLGAVENTQGLQFVLRRVFAELASFLRGADGVIQTLRIRLAHERIAATDITLRLSAPSKDASHLERVAAERLLRLNLPAPVLEIELASDRLRHAEHAQNLFWRQDEDNGLWPAVLDRLRARLGHDAVGWLTAPADHRPDRATAVQDSQPSTSANWVNSPPRPLWLIEPPDPLPHETLSWLAGPERIESGWWDEDQRRDYYRALDERGRLLWVFRDLGEARKGITRYYLHGLFG